MRERNNELHVRLNDEEYRKLDSLSHISGISFNAVIRKLIMGTEIRQRPSADFMALATAIDRLGNNVNQITKKANTNNAVSYADMKEVCVGICCRKPTANARIRGCASTCWPSRRS